MRWRLAEVLRDSYGPPPSNRHEWDDGLMWNAGIAEQVERLLSGAPMDLQAWELPPDVRTERGLHDNDQVMLVGDQLVLALPWRRR